MTRWIGRWMMVVGVVHCLFGFVFLGGYLSPILAEGVFNTVNGQPERELVVWFLVTGFLLILLGLMIDRSEARGVGWPAALAWGFAALTLAILVIMPISGGWLLVPAAIGLIVRRPRG